jgi:hypothetical protein
MKLHQLLALLPNIKDQASRAKTDVYQLAQKTPLFQGLSRVYSPREENGYVYPPETKSVQFKAQDLLAKFQAAVKEFIDLAATQDYANCSAKANVVVDGVVLLENVPVTNLLFLEKQVEDLRIFVNSLPVLDLDKEWTYSDSRGCYVSSPKETVKTKKITEWTYSDSRGCYVPSPKETVKTNKITGFVVGHEATKEHPAQIKEVSKDVIEGTWTAIDFSGALKADTIQAYRNRVDKLHKAIVIAREEANSIEIRDKQVADSLLNYVFSGNIS